MSTVYRIQKTIDNWTTLLNKCCGKIGLGTFNLKLVLQIKFAFQTHFYIKAAIKMIDGIWTESVISNSL